MAALMFGRTENIICGLRSVWGWTLDSFEEGARAKTSKCTQQFTIIEGELALTQSQTDSQSTPRVSQKNSKMCFFYIR